MSEQIHCPYCGSIKAADAPDKGFERYLSWASWLWWREMSDLQQAKKRVPAFFRCKSDPTVIGLINAAWRCPRNQPRKIDTVSNIPFARRAGKMFSWGVPWDLLTRKSDLIVGGRVTVVRLEPGDEFTVTRNNRRSCTRTFTFTADKKLVSVSAKTRSVLRAA